MLSILLEILQLYKKYLLWETAVKILKSLSDLSSVFDVPESASGEVKTGYDGKQQQIRVYADNKRRAGKTVTLATGFQSSPAELEEIAAKLKKQCGAGGRTLDNEIEVQGNHVEAVKKYLLKQGYKMK